MAILTHPALEGVVDNSHADVTQDSIALIADDENASREVLSMRLSRFFGYKVHSYERVRDAERFIRRGRDPLLIAFVDFSFPGEDGTDVIRALREYLPMVPIMSVSGYDMTNRFADPFLNPDMTVGKNMDKRRLEEVLNIGKEVYLARRHYFENIPETGKGPLSKHQVYLSRLGILKAGRDVIGGIESEKVHYDKAA